MSTAIEIAKQALVDAQTAISFVQSGVERWAPSPSRRQRFIDDLQDASQSISDALESLEDLAS